jgi:hypothetical protein
MIEANTGSQENLGRDIHVGVIGFFHEEAEV